MWTAALALIKRFWPYAAAFVVFIALILLVSHCAHRDTTAEQQAQQTNRSGEAAANAAHTAITTLENRTVTEANLDATVRQATQDIRDAQTVDAVRDIVLSSVCGSKAHINDPACRVQPVNP